MLDSKYLLLQLQLPKMFKMLNKYNNALPNFDRGRLLLTVVLMRMMILIEMEIFLVKGFCKCQR